MESFHVEVPVSSTEPQRAPTAWSLSRGDSNRYCLSSHLLPAGSGAAVDCIQSWYRKQATWGWLWGAPTPTHHYRSKKHHIFLYFTSLLPLGNVVSSELFKIIYCFSSQCLLYRLPRHCGEICLSCTCVIQRFLLGKGQHRMNTKPETVLWIHAALHHTSHVESQLRAWQVDGEGVFTAATLQF